jgi:hypothetical protein
MTFEEGDRLGSTIDALKDALEEIPTDKLPHDVYRVMKGMLDTMDSLRRAVVDAHVQLSD